MESPDFLEKYKSGRKVSGMPPLWAFAISLLRFRHRVRPRTDLAAARDDETTDSGLVEA